jgi:hypothetical protein
MIPPEKLHRFARRRGSALVAGVLSIIILAVVAGQVLLNITAKMATPHRSGAWNEALAAAEAGVDMTVADLTGLLPDVRLSTQQGVSLGAPSIPPNIISALSIGSGGINLSQGVPLSYEATTLTHEGEGSDRATATVTIDALPLSTLLGGQPLSLGGLLGTLSNPSTLLSNGPDIRLVRLRSRGTVELSGPPRADAEKADTKLRRVTLRRDRTTGTATSQPTVSREVEVVLRPVLPFQNAVATTGDFVANSGSAVFDSFNSLTPLTSTGGRYDVTKRSQNGDLAIGGSHVTLNGRVYGDVRTGGSSLAQSSQITGTVDNNYSSRLPVLRTPTWSPNVFTPADVTATTTVNAGSVLLPARVKVGNVNGTLRVDRGFLGLGTTVEIWITGDVTGGIEIADGVAAKIYIQGQVRMNAGRLVNGSGKANNLQIFGIGDDPASGARGMELEISDAAAAIYAPTHHVILTGNGNFSGAIAAASFSAAEGVQVHYDEALGLNVGPVLSYAIASYVERRF